MAARKKTPKLVATKQKPIVIVHHLRDFTAVRPAIPAFDLPDAYVEAPCYAYSTEHGDRSTLFDAIPEPRVPKDLSKRAFLLVDAILELMTTPDDSPLGAGPWSRGFHASATMEQMVARFEADGFQVITVAELAARASKPRPLEGSRARLRRVIKGLGKAIDVDVAARLARWIEEGGAEPDAPADLVALLASALLDEELETWGPIEDRTFALAARRRVIAGLTQVASEERIGIDRWGLFADRLRRAGWSEDEITDAWLDGIAGDHDWTSAKWFAMGLIPRIEPLVRRILDRADRIDPAPALARLLAKPIEDLPAELEPIYRAAVRRFVDTSDLARSLGPETWERLASADDKAFGKLAQKAKPLAPPAMIVTSSPRLAEVSARYGFDLPEEVLAIWDLARSLSRKDPTVAFAEDDDLGISLVGPFDLLAGRTQTKPGLDVKLHYRYRFDPPEFFTVAVGNVDGLHFGYWLDDPAAGPACVAACYAHDRAPMYVPGLTLWQAIRWELESTWAGVLDNIGDDPQHEGTYLKALASLARLRDRISAHATGDRKEIGDAYREKYDLRGLRPRHALAVTLEGMGVIAPADRFRPLSVDAGALGKTLTSKTKRRALVRETLALAEKGFPASALALGRQCWARGLDDEAYTLLDAAYAGLDRPLLREVLALHREHRDLASVDVLVE
ncbi:MAG: DUF2228 domain-containing protein [Minicystis sp.]